MRKKLTKAEVKSFRQTVYDFDRHHRRRFPWRQTLDPYKILVSEIMLQQTQADRVVEKYNFFVKKFPTVKSLADAELREILSAWHGLGYNRRAAYLQRTAQEIVRKHGGRIPQDTGRLRQLPGIGPYTAAAVAVFAFNRRAIVLETNIRTVFIKHFFPRQKSVNDQRLLPLIEQALDYHQPRRWYAALMDYGAMLKKKCHNPSRRSQHYTRQSPFSGSDRQARGAIITELLNNQTRTERQLIRVLGCRQAKIAKNIRGLIVDGLVIKNGARYYLAA